MLTGKIFFFTKISKLHACESNAAHGKQAATKRVFAIQILIGDACCRWNHLDACCRHRNGISWHYLDACCRHSNGISWQHLAW